MAHMNIRHVKGFNIYGTKMVISCLIDPIKFNQGKHSTSYVSTLGVG